MVVAPVHGGDEEQLLENVRRLSIFLPARTNIVKLRNNATLIGLIYFWKITTPPSPFLDFSLEVAL